MMTWKRVLTLLFMFTGIVSLSVLFFKFIMIPELLQNQEIVFVFTSLLVVGGVYFPFYFYENQEQRSRVVILTEQFLAFLISFLSYLLFFIFNHGVTGVVLSIINQTWYAIYTVSISNTGAWFINGGSSEKSALPLKWFATAEITRLFSAMAILTSIFMVGIFTTTLKKIMNKESMNQQGISATDIDELLMRLGEMKEELVEKDTPNMEGDATSAQTMSVTEFDELLEKLGEIKEELVVKDMPNMKTTATTLHFSTLTKIKELLEKLRKLGEIKERHVEKDALNMKNTATTRQSATLTEVEILTNEIRELLKKIYYDLTKNNSTTISDFLMFYFLSFFLGMGVYFIDQTFRFILDGSNIITYLLHWVMLSFIILLMFAVIDEPNHYFILALSKGLIFGVGLEIFYALGFCFLPLIIHRIYEQFFIVTFMVLPFYSLIFVLPVVSFIYLSIFYPYPWKFQGSAVVLALLTNFLLHQNVSFPLELNEIVFAGFIAVSVSWLILTFLQGNVVHEQFLPFLIFTVFFAFSFGFYVFTFLQYVSSANLQLFITYAVVFIVFNVLLSFVWIITNMTTAWQRHKRNQRIVFMNKVKEFKLREKPFNEIAYLKKKPDAKSIHDLLFVKVNGVSLAERRLRQALKGRTVLLLDEVASILGISPNDVTQVLRTFKAQPDNSLRLIVKNPFVLWMDADKQRLVNELYERYNTFKALLRDPSIPAHKKNKSQLDLLSFLIVVDAYAREHNDDFLINNVKTIHKELDALNKTSI